MMPQQRPGLSKQDYQTPPEFIKAVKALFGLHEFEIDIAADSANSQAAAYCTTEMNALSLPWNTVYGGLAWLNPPYSNIKPWVAKAYDERWYCHTLMLVPASVGANWFRDYVFDKAAVRFLSGRLTFVGCTAPYPKDCMLLEFGRDVVPGCSIWDWRTSLTETQT